LLVCALLDRVLLARALLLKPPVKKSKKPCGCLGCCATRLRAGFFGSATGGFSVASAVVSGAAEGAAAAGASAAVGATGVTAGASSAVGLAAGASATAGVAAGAGAAVGATAGVAAGARAAVGATAGAAAGARAAVGATGGAAVGAAFAAAFAAAFCAAFDAAGAVTGAAATVVAAGRLAATEDDATALARAANASGEYCRTGAGGGWFLASEGSTNEWKPTAQTAYTARQPPTVSRMDGRRC